MTQSTETVSQLTRPIIGIENRTPLEVFDIMCDRIDHAARVSTNKDETIAKMRATLARIDEQVSHGKMGDWSIALTNIRSIVREVLTSTKKEG